MPKMGDRINLSLMCPSGSVTCCRHTLIGRQSQTVNHVPQVRHLLRQRVIAANTLSMFGVTRSSLVAWMSPKAILQHVFKALIIVCFCDTLYNGYP
jgi:nucleoside permease NupC